MPRMPRRSLGAVIRGEVALRRQFPNVDSEAIEAFTAACGSGEAPEAEAVAALADMEQEAQVEAAAGAGGRASLAFRGGEVKDVVGRELVDLNLEGGDAPPRLGTVLRLGGLEQWLKVADASPTVALAVPSGQVFCLEPQEGPVCFRLFEYGAHELRLLDPDGKSMKWCRFKVTSNLGDFAEALDHFHDACDWAWDGRWTEELEDATVTLLSAIDDHFEALEAMISRSPMIAEPLRSDLEPSKKRLVASLAKVLDQHDIQSMGRVYGAVRSLLQSQGLFDMFAPMLGQSSITGPLQDSALYQSVICFERARFGAASTEKNAEVRQCIHRLVETADAYTVELLERNSTDFPTRWGSELRDLLVGMRDDPEAAIHPLPFQRLRGGDTSMVSEMMKGMLGGGAGSAGRSDTIEVHSSLSPQMSYQEAAARVTRWAESLVDESVSFGSPMSPFELHAGEPWVRTVLAAHASVLSLGFGYVSQGDKEGKSSRMVVLLDRVRAALPLNSEEEFLGDRRRRDRLKDVCRVLRALKKKGQRLSLTVNTDFSGALKALKEHHTDNWVGPSLESIWDKMVPDQRVFAFELWFHENADAAPKLVAADFGHPHTHGRVYYVATRFFDREFRNLQPGFALAYAESECLKRAGFALWDLGGADHSPMMQYKPQVAIEMDRSEHLRILREIATEGGGLVERMALPLTDPGSAPPAGGDRIPAGVVFADLAESELWGATALFEQEEKAKKEEEAAKKAAKKIQKPSKAERKGRPPDAEKKAAGKVVNGVKPKLDAKPKVEAKADSKEERRDASAAPAEASTSQAPAEVPTSNAPVTAAAAPAFDPAGRSPADSPAAPDPKTAADAKKDLAKQQFLVVFQRLLAEGVSQTEAAAQALQIVQGGAAGAASPGN